MPSRSSFSKFSDDLAEYLYEAGPDEECGDSSMGPGWAGLFIDVTPDQIEDYPEARQVLEESAPNTCFILYEDTQGFVEYDEFESEEEARDHWESVCDELEPKEGEGEEEEE